MAPMESAMSKPVFTDHIIGAVFDEGSDGHHVKSQLADGYHIEAMAQIFTGNRRYYDIFFYRNGG